MIPAVVAGNTVPVTRLIALTVLTVAACTVWAGARAARADEPQQLFVDLSGGSPRIERLNTYDTQRLIRMRVFDPAAQRVGVAGVAPDGSTIDALLARAEDGFYTGTLALRIAGPWELSIDTTDGGEDVVTQRFTVAAADYPPASEAEVMLALSGASIFSGIGLIAVGRRASMHSN
jgi:hypothetical protein